MSETRFGRKVSDFIENDVKVNSAGKVTGTLKYVTGYTKFDETTPEHQEGNYFPFKLNKVGTEIEVKKNGTTVRKVAYDPNWIIRLENTTDKFEFLLDGESLITLDFSDVKLLSGVEVKAPSATVAVENKTVQDIQSGIKISDDNKVTGKSLYVKGINNAGGDGNYLVFTLPQAKDKANTVTCTYEGGDTTQLSPDDYQYLIKLKEKKPVTIKITGKVNTTRKLDISEVILMQPINEVITARDGEASTYNKQVKDLQENIDITETSSGKGEATGTIKWVTDYQNGTGITEGNWFAIHIDKTKLPSENVKVGFGNTLVAPDPNDWNYNFRLNDREDKLLKVEVDGKILYQLDLSNLTLSPKQD